MKTMNPLILVTAALAVANLSYAQTDFTEITLYAGDDPAGAAWIDFDGDGHLDLAIANGVASPGAANVLYQNNGDSTFTQITSGPIVEDVGFSISAAWGDYDNDGFPDLLFGQAFGSSLTLTNLLYHNQGGATFEQAAGPNARGNFDASWVDYDNDGFLDIFLANTDGPNYLYRNRGDGTFAGVNVPSFVPNPSGGNVANGAAWADYDNDGFLDLFEFRGSGHNSLFHNNRDGTFTPVLSAPFNTDNGPSVGAAWGDYDNDGYLDLFVANGNFDAGQHRNFLYHNNGNGTFTKVTVGAIVTDAGSYVMAAWEDFDNDGNLDLLVSQNTGGANLDRHNALYHNNGDGTFTSLTNSTLVADSGRFNDIAWGDYDNDGFPDVVIIGESSALYQNAGNSNAWISFKLVGTVSNRSAIGAKVRVKATIRNKSYWQMREITSDGLAGNSLNPHFGLGDATNIETVRIEWPSGTVQDFQNVAPRQFLTVTEPSRLLVSATNGVPQLTLRGGRNLQYDLQWSTNLNAWSLFSMLTITNLNGTALVTDTNTLDSDPRFYRAVLH